MSWVSVLRKLVANSLIIFLDYLVIYQYNIKFCHKKCSLFVRFCRGFFLHKQIYGVLTLNLVSCILQWTFFLNYLQNIKKYVWHLRILTHLPCWQIITFYEIVSTTCFNHTTKLAMHYSSSGFSWTHSLLFAFGIEKGTLMLNILKTIYYFRITNCIWN